MTYSVIDNVSEEALYYSDDLQDAIKHADSLPKCVKAYVIDEQGIVKYDSNQKKCFNI